MKCFSRKSSHNFLPRMGKAASIKSFYDSAFANRLAFTAADLAEEVFLECDLGIMHPFAFRRPVYVARRHFRLRDDATPLSPKSARQTAFHVASEFGDLPSSNAPILCTVTVTMDSIVKPVFGTPTGTGDGPTG